MDKKRLRLSLLIAALLGCLGVWLAMPWLGASLTSSYNRIEPGLYLGEAVARPPWGTEAVVNLCGQEDPYKIEHSLWDPVLVPGKEPSLEWLERVVTFIDAQRRAGRQTYVHCYAGVNRSATAVTAYMMYAHGWGRDEALASVKARRPEVSPYPPMMRLLAEWEMVLAERGRKSGEAETTVKGHQ